MRRAFAFAGVDESFVSEQFDREWEKSSAKQGDKYQFMEKLIKLPGSAPSTAISTACPSRCAGSSRKGRPRSGQAAGAEAEGLAHRRLAFSLQLLPG